MSGWTFLKEVVEHFTVETSIPQKFDIIEMSDLELQAVTDRLESFVDALAQGDHYDNSSPSVLTLTQDEINGFIGHSDYLQGNMMVSLHKNLIEEEFSLPMDVLGYNDRYFVGEDYMKLENNNNNRDTKNSIEMKMTTAATHEEWFNGPLFFAQIQYLIAQNKEDEGKHLVEMFFENGTFFGQKAIIDEHYNLLEPLYDASNDDNWDMVHIIDGIESVSIEEGKIVIKARQN